MTRLMIAEMCNFIPGSRILRFQQIGGKSLLLRLSVVPVLRLLFRRGHCLTTSCGRFVMQESYTSGNPWPVFWY